MIEILGDRLGTVVGSDDEDGASEGFVVGCVDNDGFWEGWPEG